MTIRNQARMISTLGMVSTFVLRSAAAWAVPMDCSTTEHITGSITLNADYATTSATNPCFSIDNASNVVFNMNGHTITCNNASGCGGGAILVNYDNVTIKNGHINSGSGDFSECIQNGGNSAVHTTKVQKIICDGAGVGVLFPGTLVENSVFTNITTGCLVQVFALSPAGAKYQQNFCESASYGITTAGPSSGTHVLIQQNYVRTSGTTPGIQQQSGLIDIEQNIIDASAPISHAASGYTLDGNICADTVVCPLPTDVPFALTVTINF